MGTFNMLGLTLVLTEYVNTPGCWAITKKGCLRMTNKVGLRAVMLMTKTDPTLDGTTVTVTGLKLKMHHQDAWKLNRKHDQARWASARRKLCPQPLSARAYEAGKIWALLIILEMKKGRLRKGKGLLQGHIAYEQNSKHVLQAVNGNEGQAVSHQAR